MCLMIFILNCTAVQSEEKKRERETLVVTATAHFCCRVEEKKGINLIKLCVIFRL